MLLIDSHAGIKTMMTTDLIFEAAKQSDTAVFVRTRDGYRSLAYWRQVSVEFERIKHAECLEQQKRRSSTFNVMDQFA